MEHDEKKEMNFNKIDKEETNEVSPELELFIRTILQRLWETGDFQAVITVMRVAKEHGCLPSGLSSIKMMTQYLRFLRGSKTSFPLFGKEDLKYPPED